MPDTPEFPEQAVELDGADELTYEQARAALDDVVRRLESGGVSLEDALELWELGELLADLCEQWLEGAQARLNDGTGQSDSDEDDT